MALALSSEADTVSGESLTSVNAPVTIKVGDGPRLNLNGGWLFDSATDASQITWGGGLEWDVRKSWTLVAEVFGLTGDRGEPRTQVGLRYTPTRTDDIDVIYGHNIVGEHASWITAGLTIRFQADLP